MSAAGVSSEGVACGYCGALGVELHRDHIIPASRGGPDEARNCVVACAACNLSKSDRTPSEWQPTGLPPWLYEVERNLTHRYRMTPRGRRGKEGHAPIPGIELLVHQSPVCLEVFRHGLCATPAAWEVGGGLEPSWGAKCADCAHFYAERFRRELLEERRIAIHILAQLRDGTLKSERELTLLAIARAGGVSINEYLDLAIRMLLAERAVRELLKRSFPVLGLDVWGPAASAEDR